MAFSISSLGSSFLISKFKTILLSADKTNWLGFSACLIYCTLIEFMESSINFEMYGSFVLSYGKKHSANALFTSDEDAALLRCCFGASGYRG